MPIPFWEGNTKLEASYRSLGSQSLCDPYSPQDGDSDIGLRFNQKRGHDVLNQSEGQVLPDTHLTELLTIPPNCRDEQGLLVQGVLLWPFDSSPCPYQGALTGIKVASQMKDLPFLVSQ